MFCHFLLSENASTVDLCLSIITFNPLLLLDCLSETKILTKIAEIIGELAQSSRAYIADPGNEADSVLPHVSG